MSHPAPGPAAARFRYRRLLVVVALGAILAFLALRSSSYVQYVPWMPRPLGVWADRNGVVRNTVAFAGLALAVYVLLGSRPRHIAALCVFGTAIEVAQLWIPSRTFDWKDIVASVAGILIAWPFGWAARRSIASRQC